MKTEKKLLKGLMDADGCNSNTPSFSTSIPQVRDDFVFLVRSLGYGCRVVERPHIHTQRKKLTGKLAYKISIYTNDVIFKLQEKYY